MATPPDEHPHDDPFLSFVDVAVSGVSRQAPQIDHDAMRLVLLLHRVTSAIVYDLESAVHRPSGWSWAAFRLLFVLWVLGPVDSKTAATSSGMSRPAVTALVRTLERDGLIRRLDRPDDRRSVVIGLTTEGRNRLGEAFGDHNEREKKWLSRLTAEEQTALASILGKLSNEAQDDWVRRR